MTKDRAGSEQERTVERGARSLEPGHPRFCRPRTDGSEAKRDGAGKLPPCCCASPPEMPARAVMTSVIVSSRLRPFLALQTRIACYPLADVEVENRGEISMQMGQILPFVIALSSCKAAPPNVDLAQCWERQKLSISEGARVTAYNAFIGYRSDGATTLHPADCDTAPLWLSLSEAALNQMSADRSASDWHGVKFFRANIKGITEKSDNAPLGLVVKTTDIRDLRRAEPPRWIR